MDASAENYDADATLDDGSCTWNGGCASSFQTACADFAVSGQCYNTSYTCDGSSEYGNAFWPADCADGSDEGEFCCENGAYGDCTDLYGCDDVFNSGLVDDCAGVCDGASELDYCGVCDGGNVANECEEEVNACIAAGGLLVNMFDSYGDGWDNGSLTIGTESFTIDGPSGEACYMGGIDVAVTCGGSSWNYEITWTISDANGVVLEGGAPYNGCLGTCDDAAGGDECVNDDSTSDAYGDTCSDWYTAATSWGCGNYDDADFNAATQCCACQGDGAFSNNDDLSDDSTQTRGNGEISERKIADAKAYMAEQQYRIDNPIATSNTRDEDCGGTGPDTDCFGECFGVAVDDCAGECGGTAWNSDCGCVAADNSGDDCDDCAGTPNGDASTDNCGTCDADGYNDCVQDCTGAWGGTAWDSDCGCVAADNSGDDCDDCAGTPDGDAEVDCAGVCNGSSVEDDCGVCDGYASTGSGDINVDGTLDVIDIVLMVSYVVNEGSISDCELMSADINEDGVINIYDVVMSVHAILNADLARTSNYISNAPSSVEIIKSSDDISYQADKNGLIGFEFTLTHGDDFSISLNESSFASDYNTIGNETKVVMVMETGSELFSVEGDYEIEEVLVGVVTGELFNVTIVDVPTEFALSQAYPNPFNPTISFDLSIATEGYASISVYNLIGQVVGNIHNGNLTASTHSFVWDAGDLSSGMYILQAQSEGNIKSQKIMLLK
jgi:hypothetical protein